MSHKSEGGSVSGAHSQGEAFSQIIGRSAAILGQIEKARACAGSHSAVMITGETGTGKEVFARAIHQAGERREGPFIPVNCSAVPIELAESEMFGHVPGAFTGASRSHKGFVEQADGGTLFLDEIDSLAVAAQAKLLRFAQSHEYQPLGGEQLRHSDARIISATNGNLLELVRSGRFREDLYYRICVLIVALAPLRERREDIPLLANHTLLRLAARRAEPPGGGRKNGSNSNATGVRVNGNTVAEKLEGGSPSPQPSPPGEGVSAFTASALDKLSNYRWPGNVRELENIVERAIVAAAGNIVDAQHIDLSMISPVARDNPQPAAWCLAKLAPLINGHGREPFTVQKKRAVVEFEHRFLTEIMEEHGGNITEAAKAAGKERRTFAKLLAKHHLINDVWPLDKHILFPFGNRG